MRVYETIRAYLFVHGIKQNAAAKAAGIPTATFNAMMNGKRKIYAEDLRAICISLQVSADTFINIKT